LLAVLLVAPRFDIDCRVHRLAAGASGAFRPTPQLYNPRPAAFDDTRWWLPAIQRRN
jgi:hypothetical protein